MANGATSAKGDTLELNANPYALEGRASSVVVTEVVLMEFVAMERAVAYSVHISDIGEIRAVRRVQSGILGATVGKCVLEEPH